MFKKAIPLVLMSGLVLEHVTTMATMMVQFRRTTKRQWKMTIEQHGRLESMMGKQDRIWMVLKTIVMAMVTMVTW